MKVANLKRQGNLVTFEVEDEYAQLEVEMDKKFRDLVKKVKIPGFRLGKSPKGHFMNWYGADRLSFEALMDLLNDQYSAIISEHKIDVIDRPMDVQVLQLEQDKPFRVSISVEVKPEVKIVKYKGIKLEKDSVKVEKDEVIKAIQAELDSSATYEENATAPIEENALVVLDILANIEGEPIDEWTKNDFNIKVGEAEISDEFDHEIKGMRQGDEKAFTVKSADKTHEGVHVQSEPVNFHVTIKSVKVKQTPKLTDEWVRSRSDKRNVDDYRRSIESGLKTSKEQSAEEKLKLDAVNWVIENVENEIPEAMIRQQVDWVIQQLERDMNRMNITLATYLQITGKTLDALRAEHRDDAIKRVKYHLGLDAIAEAEGIKVSQEELEKDIEDNLKKENDEEKKDALREQLHQLLSKDREVFEEPLRYRKVIDFLLEHAKIKKN